jgi:glycosyltransferase involved in cell wall biosynthesis
MTRVVHVSPASFGATGLFGGGERYPFELARYMADVVQTRLVTFADRPFQERVGQLEVVALGHPWYVRGQRGNPIHSGLIRHLAWADVIHCHQRVVVASSIAAAFGRATGRRVFVSDLGGGGWDVSAYVRTDRWYNAHLHLSKYSRTLAGHADWNRAHVIYGGVDTDRFVPDPAVPKEPMIVFVGRLLPHKGINYLVDAIPDGLTLELIGRPYHDGFDADLKRMAAGKRVIFRHDCDDAEVIRAYRRAACVVLPSVYRTMYGDETTVPELLGQTLLEGMACGTPAVCTAVASMPEVVADGETGFVVLPNDSTALRTKLIWIRDHPQEAAEMGRAGRQRILSRFTWPAVVAKCLEAYTSAG